jgi:outer membrane protein TolC
VKYTIYDWRLAVGALACALALASTGVAAEKKAKAKTETKQPSKPAKQKQQQAKPEKSAAKSSKSEGAVPSESLARYAVTDDSQMIDLPTALRLAGAQNLDVLIAQEKLAEAKALHEQARQQFFPWVSPGVSYRRHDGQIQAVEGRVFDASKQSYTAGGAINAQVDFGETWYQSLAAKQTAKAAEFAVEAERQQAVYQAAAGYFELARAQAQIGVAKESLRVSEDYAKQLDAAVTAGIAFKGDLHRVRAQTERYRLAVLRAEEQQRLAGARLAQTLRLNPAVALEAPQAELVPLALVTTNTPLDRLIAQALHHRPELSRQSALAKAAKEEERGAVVGPMIPSLQAQTFLGGLGGGFNNDWHNFDATANHSLMFGWRVGPGGLLDRPRQKAAEARVKSAGLLTEKFQDAVVAEVVSAVTRVDSLARQLETARRALASAVETVKLSRQRKEFGVGAVLENIQAEQDLAAFRNDYLALVAGHNQAQYALLMAVGQAAGH